MLGGGSPTPAGLAPHPSLCLQPPPSRPPSLSFPPSLPPNWAIVRGSRGAASWACRSPPGDSGNFSIQHFLWERWAEGHWKPAFRALGPHPALEAKEGSLTVAKGMGYF